MKLGYKLIAILLPVFVAAIWGCEQDGTCGFGEQTDYVVFGSFYGYCIGEGCIDIYKIDQTHLFEDTLDMYPQSDDFYPGHFTTRWANEKFELVKDLKLFFPESLLNETEVIQGHPDAGDWGGIYFEIKRGNTHRFWLLDQRDEDMPADYNAFVDKINEKITLINQ
ncbi:MAG: hypothetical protein ABIQ02_04280 [Saprospiraceae bacterium]